MAIIDFNSAPRQARDSESCQPEPEIQGLAEAMAAEGYHPQNLAPTETGRVSRFALDDDRGGDKTGWYIYSEGKWPCAVFGDWRSGQSFIWRGYHRSRLTPEQLAAAEAEIRAQSEASERQRAEDWEFCQRDTAEKWAIARPCENHPYLARKGVPSHGLRIWNGMLLIPMLDFDGAMRSISRVWVDGEKKFWPGTQVKGLHHVIPGSETLAIVEGYATGASVHAATGWTVYVAFDAGNLIHVGRALRAARPTARIVICGDDDRFKAAGNAGRMNGDWTAQDIGAQAVYPTFTDLSRKPTDWNDLASLEGLEAVRQQLEAKVPPSNRHVLDQIRGGRPDPTRRFVFEEPPPMRWVFQDAILRKTSFILCGAGGTGKTFIGLELAASLAIGRPLLGPVFTPATDGSALVLLSEEIEEVVWTRVHAMAAGMTEVEREMLVQNMRVEPALGQDMRLVRDLGSGGLVRTEIWQKLLDTCREIPNLALLVLDPLNLLHGADLERNEEAAQFFCSAIASLCQELDIAACIVHHSVKNATGRGKGFDVAEALHADNVRGSGAIVAGMRGAANFVTLPPSVAKKELGLALRPEEGEYIAGKISKINNGRQSGIFYLRRDDNGLLHSVEPRQARNEEEGISQDLMLKICAEIRELAERGKYVTKNTFLKTYYPKWQIKRALLDAAIEQCLLDEWLCEFQGENANKVKTTYLKVADDFDLNDEDTIGLDFNE